MSLIQQTETLVDHLEKMVPADSQTWLDWRVKQLNRRIADAKQQLHRVVEQIQEELTPPVDKDNDAASR